MIAYSNITSARERIKKYIYNTPLELSYQLSNNKNEVYLKLEAQQKLKSFKIRGALSKITWLSNEERSRGIIAVSSGNHGAGVSYASYILGGIKTKVYIPETTPKSKFEKIKYYGAEVIKIGKNYDEARAEALEAVKREGLTFIDPCSDIQTISGQGTISLEILEKNPQIDTIVAPIGGGGLITGLSIAAKHIKPTIKIIGVQTSACPAMVCSLKDKICYEEYPSKPSICDALIGGVGEIPYKMADKCIDDIIVVSETAIQEAIIKLMKNDKVIAEPAGAATAAAVIENPEYFYGKKVAIIISGGNLDETLMKTLIMSD